MLIGASHMKFNQQKMLVNKKISITNAWVFNCRLSYYTDPSKLFLLLLALHRLQLLLD